MIFSISSRNLKLENRQIGYPYLLFPPAGSFCIGICTAIGTMVPTVQKALLDGNDTEQTLLYRLVPLFPNAGLAGWLEEGIMGDV